MKWLLLLKRTRSFVSLALAVGLLSSVSGLVQADEIIDNFTNPSPVSQSLSAGPGGGAFGPMTTTAGPFAGVIGGYRTLNLSGFAFTNQSVSLLAGNGTGDLATASLSSASASFVYDANMAGLGALLAGLTSVDISLLALDAGSAGLTIAVTALDNMAVSDTVSMDFLMNLGATMLSFDFSSSLVDFNDLDSLTVSIEGIGDSTAFDVTVDTITAIIPPPPTEQVPEPAALATWCLVGLVGLGHGIRRRRRRLA